MNGLGVLCMLLVSIAAAGPIVGGDAHGPRQRDYHEGESKDNDTECLEINQHLGELLAYLPTGLCCPARRAMIHASPYANLKVKDELPIQSFYSPTQRDLHRVRYAGTALMQDSKDSLGLNAAFHPLAWEQGEIVQMWLFAYYKPNCANSAPGACVKSDFFQPGSSPSTPRQGNMAIRLQTSVAPVGANLTFASGAWTISSFHMWPLGILSNSVGYELHVTFLAKGTRSVVATTEEVLFAQLYSPECDLASCEFLYEAVFPARIDFGP